MAIAHVVSGHSNGTAFSLASSGSDRILIAFSGGGTTAMNYNGTTVINTHTYTPSFPVGTNCPAIKVWVLANPDTGTNTLTPSGSGFVVASIYSGVAPGGVEAYNDEDSANVQTGTWTGTVTVTTNNSWAILCNRVNNTTNDFNAGSGTTKRTSHAGVGDDSLGMFDSAGGLAPGSNTLHSSLTSSSGFFTSVMLSLTPVFQTAGTFAPYL